MRLGFSTLCCPDWPLDRIIAAAVEHGIGGIELRGLGEEIDVTRLLAFSVSLDQTLATLRSSGIQVPCVSTSVTLVCPAGPRWQAMLEECQRSAELAAAMGTPLVRIFGGTATGDLTDDEAMALARRRIRQIVKLCRPLHCRPVVETHDAWSTSSRMLELLDGLDSDVVGISWNVEHSFRAGQSPRELVRNLGSYLAHVHLKDSLANGRPSTPTLLGDGEIPLEDSLQALRSSAYHGWVCLETDKRWQPEAPSPQESIPQFAAFMRRWIDSAAPSSVAGAS
jgi:sugar phosphate isomerase/epimerase